MIEDVEARTNENIKKVEVLVSADRRIRVLMIANYSIKNVA
jgi:hypothetical protein